MHSAEESLYEYDFSFTTPSDKLTFPVRTLSTQIVDHCKHARIIKDGSTFFIKFDFKSKYSDYEKASSIFKKPVIELMEWDTSELYDDYFHDPSLDNYKFTRFVEGGTVSNYIIFEIPNFIKNTKIDTVLLRTPFTLFDRDGIYPLKGEASATIN